MFDIVIIGSGPAGLTASIYAKRSGKDVLVIEKEIFGGNITHSPRVDNYPSFNQISGSELGEKMMLQASDLGVEIEMDDILSIEKEDKHFIVKGKRNTYDAKSIIIATGSKHRTLGLEKEEDFTGKGVSYCAVCDGPFYAGKVVAVVGGGNSALQEAILLSSYCKKVIILQNLPFLTGENGLVQEVKKLDNIEIKFDVVVEKLIGDDELTSIIIKDTKENNTLELQLNAAFVAIGQKPENENFVNLCDLDENGFIISNEDCTTKTNGVFVAGDCRTKRIRQVVTATSDGAIAAIAACKYIDGF